MLGVFGGEAQGDSLPGEQRRRSNREKRWRPIRSQRAVHCQLSVPLINRLQNLQSRCQPGPAAPCLNLSQSLPPKTSPATSRATYRAKD